MALRRGYALLAALFIATAAQGQTEEARTLNLDGGARVTYTLRTYPADVHLVERAAALAPTSALNTAKLLNLHLSAGDVEEAALLSNAPRRRFEVLRDYRESIGEEEFKRVFARYFLPENRLLAEIVIDRHQLLIWELKNGAAQPPVLAGQFFVEVDGRYLMDDVPSGERNRLREVLEAYRRGNIPGR
jgi:hypothetical protein